MTEARTPENVLVTLTLLEDEFPDMLGHEHWKAKSAEFAEKLEMLGTSTNEEDQRRLVVELLGILRSNRDVMSFVDKGISAAAAVRERLTQSLSVQYPNAFPTVYQVNELCILTLKPLMLDDGVTHRAVKIAPKGEGGAESVKLQNIEPSIREIARILSTLALNVTGMVSAAWPLAAAGSWLTWLFVTEAMTEKLSEQDASVFWGLILAGGDAEEGEIIRHTNAERREARWHELTDGEVQSSLNRLEKLKCIELLDGRWKIIEKYQIKA